MTDHLPECYLSGPPSLCPMCESLRACEQRVRLEYRVGLADYAAGVKASRDAVAALTAYEVAPLQPKPWATTYEYVNRNDALAAIDALRGES